MQVLVQQWDLLCWLPVAIYITAVKKLNQPIFARNYLNWMELMKFVKMLWRWWLPVQRNNQQVCQCTRNSRKQSVRIEGSKFILRKWTESMDGENINDILVLVFFGTKTHGVCMP